MSGFGGGFGSSQQQPSGFGSQQRSSSQPDFGGGFGSSAFGSTSAAPQQGFGSTVSSTPFGGTAGSPATTFGTSSNLVPFGASTNQPPANFAGTQTSGFTSGFGNNTNQPAPFPAAQQQNQQFGGTFGGGASAPHGFGGTTAQSSPFGSNAQQPSQPPGFGSTNAFAPAVNTSSAASPFGGTAATTSSTISFGVSANVVPTGENSASGFGGSTAPTFSSSNTTFPTTFGASSSTTEAFGAAASDDEDMGDSDFNKPSPFGNPQQSGASAWGGGSTSPPPTQLSSARDASMSPTRGSFSPPVPEPPTTTRKESEQEKLARLKAKLEEKKKKLQERKRQKEAAAAAASGSAPPSQASAGGLRNAPPLGGSSSLNPNAPSFTPVESLAEKNKRRFAAPKTPRLQEGLRQKKEEDDKDEQEIDSTDREDLETAVSLVGTCLSMCPDDELQRREQENDIQLLEIPQPGTIHPDGWTLRETAVKRFRRSAADFKLNVPEWVRPPGVLEAVCAYLEEWVMERDRQGPDPRFTQVQSPPPLDVYQFIWDRTRMVRKDFILQNYVGTGGNCDARAVRCHERIARWHAMCEHQLSHIPDFVNSQSQQNITELGQTMKTLNMYYDDSLGRSTLEVADEQGVKGRGIHGCESPIVMGNGPRDFDGSPLDNQAASPNRLIGSQAAKTTTRGTAEPEMRGLYMLLTMDNDGGSEVLNYAARLFRERPMVYNSKPVQLALRIYKAKKDYNYARFFAILRSPSTPYLFACIMFKYVQQMRKVAFRIMSKTFGTKKKDLSETFYDEYPLKRLIKLLCFEDESEALAACKHYNITVKEKQVDASGKKDHVIRWRLTSYKESRDPEKNIVVPLQPRKMMRTIEAKLKGATRLAVCRGDVSGEGASLVGSDAPLPAPAATSTAGSAEPAVLERLKKEQEAAKAAAARQAEKEREEKRRQEEARVLAEKERQLKEAEARRAAQELEKRRAEEERRLEAQRKKELEEELKRKRAEEKERMKREAEEARKAQAIAAEERRRKQMEEEARRIAERLEEERRKAEEAEKERQRQVALELKREEERKLKLRQEEEARKRREEEEKRLRLLELQRQREEAERKRKAEIERKAALEWERKVCAARKLLFWRRWRQKVEGRLQAERSKEALRQIDPTYLSSRILTEGQLIDAQDAYGRSVEEDAGAASELGIEDFFRRQRLGHGEPIDLAGLLTTSKKGTFASNYGCKSDNFVCLCKIAVVLPEASVAEDVSFTELIHEWLNTKLRYGQVSACRYGPDVELRTVAVNGNTDVTNEPCDVALLVIPPRPKSKVKPRTTTIEATMNSEIPVVVMNLGDDSEHEYTGAMLGALSSGASGFGHKPEVVSIDESGDLETRLDTALETSCLKLLEAYANGYPEQVPSLQRVALPYLVRLCIRDTVWTAAYNQGPQADKRILSLTKSTITSLSAEIVSLAQDLQDSSLSKWPPREFAECPNPWVKDYFNRYEHLPLSWRDTLRPEFVEPVLTQMHGALNGSFRYVIENMLSRAPLDVRNDCEAMLDTKQFRRCLESALLWKESNAMSENLIRKDEYIYLPRGEVDNIREAVTKRLQGDGQSYSLQLSNYPAMGGSGRATMKQSPTLFSSVATMSDEDFVKETPALQRLEKDKSTTEARDEEELDYHAREGDIVPFEEGVGDFDGQASPFHSPLHTSLRQSNAEFLNSGDFLRKNKRSLDSALGSPRLLGDGNKRPRGGRERVLSQTERESKDFTSRLEALLHGEAVIDVDIGDTTLSRLMNDVPQMDLP